MPIKLDPDDLNQGSVLAVSNAIWATGTGADIRIHSGAANLLPALAVGEFFEVRDHSNTVNNGLYQVVTVNTSTDDYECDKVVGSAPVTAAGEAITTLGATGASTEKSIFWDTDRLKVLLLEQGNLDVDGVNGQAVYSRGMKDWKSDAFLIAAAPFPMLTIDADAGKYIIGQDNQGNNNGWNWEDVPAFSIRTRKLLRNAGWEEIDANGISKAKWVGIGTLGGFEDPANDTARYQFGNNTTVDDSVAFDFAGPVNEAIKFYEEIGNPPSCSFATTSTITRASGSFITDGYKVGGQVTVRAATNPANDGTFVLAGVAALTLTVVGTPLTASGADAAAQLSVDNANLIQLRLRVRDADPNGKTYAQSFLANGNYSALRPGFMTFPLANGQDLKISETDANIDANTPYTGMSLTLYATPQNTGTDLVGGPFNFGMILDANNGTNVQVFEWLQRQLRKATDIDAGAGTNIGLTLDDMARFLGDQAQFGSPDGGLSFPRNPEGGGTGLYITNLNAASKNDTVMYDNTGAQRGYPIGTPVTIDINQIFIDDTSALVKLYFDRTIRTVVPDLVINAGTGPNGTFTSAGSNLPASLNRGVGAYVRISGLVGGNAAMNGVYQVTSISAASYNVTRRDGATITTTSSASANLDENCVNTPDAIIVDTDNDLTAATISFTAPDTISDSGLGLGIFSVGDYIRVSGSTGGLNDGIYQVDTVAAGTITLIEQTITTQGAGPSVTLREVFQHAADADFSATFDYSSNVQGGRSGGTDAQVQAKGIGAQVNGAQYATSAVRTIESATPLSITLSASLERNFTP